MDSDRSAAQLAAQAATDVAAIMQLGGLVSINQLLIAREREKNPERFAQLEAKVAAAAAATAATAGAAMAPVASVSAAVAAAAAAAARAAGPNLMVAAAQRAAAEQQQQVSTSSSSNYVSTGREPWRKVVWAYQRRVCRHCGGNHMTPACSLPQPERRNFRPWTSLEERNEQGMADDVLLGWAEEQGLLVWKDGQYKAAQ
jgi:hypothetical protein